jgi:polysaccharide biosynthesis transport protein
VSDEAKRPEEPGQDASGGRVLRAARRAVGLPSGPPAEEDSRTAEFQRRVKEGPAGRAERPPDRVEREIRTRRELERQLEAAESQLALRSSEAESAANRIAELEAELAAERERDGHAGAARAELDQRAEEIERARVRLEAARRQDSDRLSAIRAGIAARDDELKAAAARIASLERALARPREPARSLQNGNGNGHALSAPPRPKPRAPRAVRTRPVEPNGTDMLGRPRASGSSIPPGVRRARVPEPDDGAPALLRGLWRRRWLIVACGVLVAALSFARATTETKTYEASASLLLQNDGAAAQFLGVGIIPDSNALTRQAQTAARLVALPAVADRTAAALHGRLSAARIRSDVRIDPASQADVVTVTAADHDPSLAAAVANAYAAQYVALRREAARAPIVQAQQSLQTQVAAGSSGASAASLISRISQLKTLAALQTGDAQVVQLASPPSAAASPNVKQDVLLGLLAGLLLGVAIAVPLELLDRALRQPDEVERIFSAPVLARVPALGGSSYDDADIDSRVLEPFRTLHTNLRYLDAEREVSTLLVTSPGRGDGKSTVARELASSAAARGANVLLIDADLSAADGLGLVLAGACAIEDVTTPAGRAEARYDLIPAGFAAPNRGALLGSDRMRSVIRELEQRYDFVVIDGPPGSVVSQAAPWMRTVGGVLVVCRLRVASRGDARQLNGLLRRMKAPLLGVVINGAEARVPVA